MSDEPMTRDEAIALGDALAELRTTRVTVKIKPRIPHEVAEVSLKIAHDVREVVEVAEGLGWTVRWDHEYGFYFERKAQTSPRQSL